MRRLFSLIALGFALLTAASAEAAKGHVLKVLPQFLDLKGRHALSPSLYDRDAYQFYLREHANEVSGIRFAVHWKTSGRPAAPLKLRIELTGTPNGEQPRRIVLETEVKPSGWFGHWTSLPIQGEDYQKFGKLTAWRVTLLEGDWPLSEQKSFLW